MKVEFDTRSYVLTYGHEPSRTVFGSWAFQFEDSPEAWFAPTALTYAEAKKAAVAEVNRRANADGKPVAASYTTTVKVLT